MLRTGGNEKRNRILQRLSTLEYGAICSDLEDISLSFKEVLYEQGRSIEHTYFVETGVVSLVTDLDHGGTIETGTIGNEGVVGVPAFLGSSVATGQAFCQIPGRASRVSVGRMLEERE